MLLSPHYSEIIKGSIMTCDGIVVMYGGGVFQMLFKPFTKGSGWFSYVLILTLQPITLVSVDDATFWVIRSLSLGAIWSSHGYNICHISHIGINISQKV